MKKLYFLMAAFLVASFSFAQTTDLLISKYGEGSGDNKFLEIYNGTGSDIDLGNYSISSCSNGCDINGEFDFPDNITFAPGTILANGDVYVISDPDAAMEIADETDVTFGFLSNGDDAYALTLAGATANTYTIIDILGDMGDDPGSGWAVAGISNGTQNATLTRKASVCSPNPVPLASFGTDAADSEWLVGDIDSGWDTVGAFVGCDTSPSITITSPSDGSAEPSGTTSVDVVFNTENAPGGAVVNISVITNGGAPVVNNNVTSPFTITPTSDGDSFNVTVELVDGGVLSSDSVNFDIAFPCDIQVGTITATCDDITPATDDTYTVTIDYTGGATTTYTIDTGGVGTVGGDDPTSVADGTIMITGVTEGTDFVVTFLGNPSNSSCDFTRDIDSPDCDPALTLPLYDDFSYADGPLVGNSQWTNHSGGPDDLLVVSGQALVQHGTPSEDVNLPFASVPGNLYFAFDMIVQDPGAPIGTGGTDFEYFAHFKDDGFGFVAQVDIVAANGGGDYSVGISSDQNTADATWPNDLTFGNTYRITVRYDQDAAIAELWVDATSESDPSILGADEADPGDTVASFAFRQSDSSENEGILIDNLAVTQTFADTLSDNEFSLADTFTVYPNPTSLGFVNIKSANTTNISVAVYDILGKAVINSELTNDKLDVSGLNSGVYIMKITQNNASVTKKLIIK